MSLELVVTGAPGGVTVLTIIGEIDMVTAPRLRSELVRLATESSTAPHIVLDLYGVDLLDTAGIGAILEGVKRCVLREGRLVLARAEPQVARELELTRLIGVLTPYAMVDDAVAAVLGG